jgi:hypothetical protein
MNFSETNGVICNRQGNILFTSNGVYVADATNDTMQNGSGLNPGNFTNDHRIPGLTLPQGNLIIPFPDDSSKYYLFHETADDRGHTYSAFYLYYSVVDMSLNNGLGAVVQKNQVLLNDSLIEGRLTSCKHANGRDWWLFSPRYMNGVMYEYLITPSGIQGPWQKNLITQRDNWFGQAVFNPQGNKFAYYEPNGDLDILDFNRCTGDFSNQVHIDINDTAAGGGAAFSPSGRYLYISSQNYIYQFDVQAANINSSKILVGVYDNYYSFGLAANFYLSALAPDGKIYINCGNGSAVLHKIDYPDSAGHACGFCQHCVALPGLNAFTIPNHPNYFLGADSTSLCDTITSVSNQIISPIQSFSLFPNPVRDQLYINHSMKEHIEQVGIINSLGQYESVQFIPISNGEYLQVDLSSFASGVYYVQVKTGKQVVTKKVVKD